MNKTCPITLFTGQGVDLPLKQLAEKTQAWALNWSGIFRMLDRIGYDGSLSCGKGIQYLGGAGVNVPL